MTAEEPWRFGPEPVYKHHADPSQALRGLVHAPSSMNSMSQDWHSARKQILREWGQKREAEMHRPPLWCMDQLCSGSGLFPPRHLDDSWFTPEELQMISSLERLLQATGHAAELARDMMALRIYDIDIRIIADDSGSMSCGMIGGFDGGWGRSGWTKEMIQTVFGRRAFRPDDLAMFNDSPFPPTTPRWNLLKDHLLKWDEVFNIMKVERKVYFLNRRADPTESMDQLLSTFPGGGTPMGSTFNRVLSEYQKEGLRQDRPCLILALTDGEANDKDVFNRTLDQIQDGLHGDVQVCLMGLSLEPEDIEWFEDEECDDTRIRTIEAWEVEQQMILYRKVIPRSDCYSFSMHVYRALVTNYFPADYDYEAPIQTLRHRLYITLHALDRRFTGIRDAKYASGMSTISKDAMTCCVPTAAVIGFLLGGVKGCACGTGLAVCASGCASSTTQKGKLALPVSSNVEEGLCDADDQLIGALVRQLQRQSLQNTGERWSRPSIYPSQLRAIQRAIGTLSPNEVQMRDLQFQDTSFNNKALDVALGYLRTAARS